MKSAIDRARTVVGGISVCAALIALVLALGADIAIFQYNDCWRVRSFVDSHEEILPRALKYAAFIGIGTLFLSFVSEGRQRAFGIARSLGALLLCSPLGAGY
jgi:hypothetical protein